ncbi:hypothetical protein OB955_03775 [Halobacteria archaeon AArc-m2/3/4]|uniref:SPW repeat-containing protein n=1 Tax=Natronoglomus mannanivorans TaxID=2979990 RepID=A0ABT2QAE8_9EURY|nr:hypothetical protein [Halobacteria archaeon AArc-m2/3/4]
MPTLKAALIGPEDSDYRSHTAVAALLLFVASFVIYTVVGHSAGVVPAVVLGVVAAAAIGWFQAGLVFAWLAVFASLTGFTAVDLVSTSAPFTEIVVTLIGPEGLMTAGVESLVLAVIAYVVGHGLHWGVESVRSDSAPAVEA